MKNYKTLLITGAAIAAVLIMIVFAVQGAGNKAIGYEESVETADEVLAQINAVAEAYPELKSQENYKQFMTEIATTENLIAQYKQAYNKSIKAYNRYVRKFPSRQFLSIIGYEVQDYEYYSTDKTDSEPLSLFN